jgi:hypothetical protein
LAPVTLRREQAERVAGEPGEHRFGNALIGQPQVENDTAVSFVIEDGRITQIFAIRNPHKLERLSEVTELRR